jgi:MFS family permease
MPRLGVRLFDGSAFANAVTDELKAYPQDLLSTPLDERRAELSFTRGPVPSGATAMRPRDGHAAPAPRDRFVDLIAVPVITVAGTAICHEALTQAGVSVPALLSSWGAPTTWLAAASVLGLGLVFGLKHALDADHLAAVSTIVSESRSLLSSLLVGAVWGVGHTLSLLVAGVTVILFHIEISERTALVLEFCVAIMLIGLGADALRKLARGGRVHLHVHEHHGHVHLHPHLHAATPEPSAETHHGLRLSMRPLLIGVIHGLAGSAALMLLVLSTIPSPLLGLAYIAVFGMGSIGGMLFMSALVGLPARLTAQRFNRAHLAVRTLAGAFSLGFGLLMAYQIGVAGGLLL